MVRVEATDLGKAYRGRVVLAGATFSLPDGSLTVLAGANGAGKTTVMKRMVDMVSGSGSTTYDGRRWEELRTPRREVGLYLGVGSFHAGVTVEGHLRLVATAARMRPSSIEAPLEQFGLGDHRRIRVSRLSLGLRQRLGLAAACLPDPPVLVLDEPFSALDPGEASEVYGWLELQVAQGRTVLVSTHHLTRIEPHATHLLFMVNGRLVADGAVDQVAERYGVPDAVAVACSAPLDLAAALSLAGVRSSLRSGDTVVVAGATPEKIAAAASAANVVIHAVWTQPAGLSGLYEAIVR